MSKMALMLAALSYDHDDYEIMAPPQKTDKYFTLDSYSNPPAVIDHKTYLKPTTSIRDSNIKLNRAERRRMIALKIKFGSYQRIMQLLGLVHLDVFKHLI